MLEDQIFAYTHTTSSLDIRVAPATRTREEGAMAALPLVFTNVNMNTHNLDYNS